MIITVYGYFFLAYIVLCLFFAINVVSGEKSKYKLFNFVIIFWFMTRQIYKSTYAWKEFSLLSKFRKADQLLAWFLLAYVIMSFFSTHRNSRKIKLQAYEKFTYGYYFLVITLLYLHRYLGNISYSRATQVIYAYFAAIFMFFSIKQFVTAELVRMMVKVVMFLSILTAIVSIFQFFGDQKVLRLAAYYMAFPGYNRASGIFHWPYDNGIMLITGAITSTFVVKSMKKRLLLIALFMIALILTFTRGVWLAGLGVAFFHLYYFYRNTLRSLFFALPIIALLSFGFFSAYLFQQDLFSGEAWQERVFKDTVSVRFAFYGIVLTSIPDAWLIGYGDVQNNDVYFKGMVNANQGMNWSMGRGGGIHNVVLEEVFLRGVFSGLLWVLSFVYMFKYAFKKSREEKNFIYCFPMYYNMAVFFYCFTVGAFLSNRSGYQSLIFFALLSGISAKKIHLEEFKFNGKQTMNSLDRLSETNDNSIVLETR